MHLESMKFHDFIRKAHRLSAKPTSSFFYMKMIILELLKTARANWTLVPYASKLGSGLGLDCILSYGIPFLQKRILVFERIFTLQTAIRLYALLSML